MASLSLKHIYKVYPNGTKAVNDFNMEIEDKEFIVFVGPSGCGKSTTLRMIAGLEDISAGELMIGDLVVNDVEPKDRDIAMVFQNYALYPHMTVYENIAFGLRLRKLPKDEIHRRVTEAAEILGITEYLDKKPKEMSGGQRQRVSLGRAIVREPKVMLLDEPLSNLDAKLRTQMRSEISKLHARLNTTFIYVTHDQVEAMTMGTRIVVMKNGYVQQIDTPKNLYNYPGNKFVAGFIGTPQMNFFEGTLLKKGEEVEIKFAYSDAVITVPYSMLYKTRPSYLDGKTTVYIGLRAEDISLDPEKVKNSNAVVKVRISHKEELGSETLVYGDINMSGDGYSESSTRVIIKDESDRDFKPGEVVDVALDMEHVHMYDKETEVSILPRIPEYNYLPCSVKGGVLSVLTANIKLPPAISCPDGDGEMLIPTDAITLGNGNDAKVVSCEEINGKYLAELLVGERRLYAVVPQAIQPGNVSFKFDIKKISILRDGKEIISPMNEMVGLDGMFLKEKYVGEQEVNGKKKKVKAVRFDYEIGGAKFTADDETSQKLITVMGLKNAFTTALVFECSVYDFIVGDSGIPATVEDIVDYGSEKFVRCSTPCGTVMIYADKDYSGKIYISPDFTKTGIIEKDRDIRII